MEIYPLENFTIRDSFLHIFGTLDYDIEHNNDSVVGRRNIVKLFLLPALMVILTKLPL